MKIINAHSFRMFSLPSLPGRWKEQDSYVDHLLSQLEAAGAEEVAKLKDNETRLQLRVQEAQRRENVLNMRLATKQQETQEIMVTLHNIVLPINERVVCRLLLNYFHVLKVHPPHTHPHTLTPSPSPRCMI